MAEPAKKVPYDVDAERGIQNATSRFKRQRESQSLQSELLRKSDGSFPGGAANDPEYAPKERGRGRSAHNSTIAGVLGAKSTLLELSNQENLGYSESDVDAFIENVPQRPAFPIVMVTAAVLKDIIDGADVTGIGIIVTTVISFLISLVLFLWFLGKMSGMQRWLWKRYVIAMVIEFIPFIKMIPATTILVLAAHYRETKLVQMINTALQKIPHGGGRR